MSVGKREKRDNCPTPVYWVLGKGIVTFILKHLCLFYLTRTTLTKRPSVAICIGKKSNIIKTYESINSIIKNWNTGLFLTSGINPFSGNKKKNQ
jgi:hypothetical protein